MPELPSNVVNPVYALIEDKKMKTPIRPYLGYSMLGHACSRYLWFYFRWMFKVYLTPQQKRLFSRGDQEEPVVVKNLRDVGIVCTDVLEDQIELVSCLGHVKGHPDGTAVNVPSAEKTEHNLEIKTANDKRFKEMVRFGIERSNPEYSVQSHCYMGKKKQTRTLFIVTNKNTDERHYERIPYRKEIFEDAENRAFDIISSPVPPKGISTSPEWYECKWCDAHPVCHQGVRYERNCRTCSNVTIHNGGEWHCGLYANSGPIPEEFQRTGCPDEYRPFL